MSETKKFRIQFDLTNDALRQLDELKDSAHAATRAEVVRDALKLYAWFLQKRSTGHTVQLKSGDKVSEVEFVGL